MKMKLGLRQEPGVYTITHMPSGKFYVGSSKNIQGRMAVHLHYLKKDKHTNRLLQEAFTSVDELEFTVVYTEGPADARSAEQDLLDVYYEHPLCCNLGNSSAAGWLKGTMPESVREINRSRMMGNSIRKGVVLSEETRRAMSLARLRRKRIPKEIE